MVIRRKKKNLFRIVCVNSQGQSWFALVIIKEFKWKIRSLSPVKLLARVYSKFCIIKTRRTAQVLSKSTINIIHCGNSWTRGRAVVPFGVELVQELEELTRYTYKAVLYRGRCRIQQRNTAAAGNRIYNIHV